MEEIKTQQTNEEIKNIKPKKSKLRIILVLIFITLFLLVVVISTRSNYLEYKELGLNYEQVFFTNLKYRLIVTGCCFAFLYIVMYFTNRGIKKGLKPFFEGEKKVLPKLPNKSISLIFAAISSALIGTSLMEKILLFSGNTSFGITDPIFGLDIGYYMFQRPLFQALLLYSIALLVILTIYSIVYYVVVFHRYFNGIDKKMLKDGIAIKKIIRNIKLFAFCLALYTLLNTQNIIFERMFTVDGNIDIIGAGYTQSTIKLWGYVIFALVIIFAIFKGIKHYKQDKYKKILYDVIIIPSYLVILFLVTASFDGLFVNSNKLEKENDYLQSNINNTKQAYNLNIEENNLTYSGTIMPDEVEKNISTINNTVIVDKETLLLALEDSQTETGHYTYKNATIGNYKIDGEDKLVYVAPRQLTNKEKTYSNKTFEYTHTQGPVVANATTTDDGNIEYIQKDVSGNDVIINIKEPRMYYGLDSYDMVATNVKGKTEYDYTDKNGKDITSTYTGKSGLQISFLDKLILGISKGNLSLAFDSDVDQNSKILINRNIIDRAKKALPYLVYDENPYTVIDDSGKIIWVLDAYTKSNQYPYSQYTSIEHDNIKEKINYIRNSVKVLIDSYSGEISFYITDRTDPIAMAYEKIYPTLFKNKDEKIPQDIAKHFIYPQYLYNVQEQVLEVYHNVKPDVLYREDDIWEVAKFNNTSATKAAGTKMDSYYTMVKTVDNDAELGLVQLYNPKNKQNIISYLVGTSGVDGNKLTLYKISQDSNCAGPMQLAKQIEEDEEISKQLASLNVSGTRITKEMIVVPINNTLLYVEPIYQTWLNEESDVPVLKKVIVASGNKVAIGNTLQLALQNLLSQNAVAIEIENTEDIDGLIEAIIKANKNLAQSNSNGNWELMGKDIEKLQSLIDSLEQVKLEKERKEKEYSDNNKTVTEQQ
ncbi:MAG: UPF0182 family protein [Clostridia bacterium]|nr:UPF0182 family protein [Clostridia bacterium]